MMAFNLTNEQRQAIAEEGTPLPLFDDDTPASYIVLKLNVVPDLKLGTVTASLPGFPAYGEGKTRMQATLTFVAALQGYIEMCAEIESDTGR